MHTILGRANAQAHAYKLTRMHTFILLFEEQIEKKPKMMKKTKKKSHFVTHAYLYSITHAQS